MKLEALETVILPTLRSGRFKGTDALITSLTSSTVMRRRGQQTRGADGPLRKGLCIKIDPALNLDLSEWDDAFPGNRVLGPATLDRLRHGAYRIVIEGESFGKPKSMPESSEISVAKMQQKTSVLRPFESTFDTISNWRHYGDHPPRLYSDP